MKSSICGLNNDNEFDMQTVVPNIDKVIKRTGCYHPNDVTTLYQKVQSNSHVFQYICILNCQIVFIGGSFDSHTQ